MSGTVTGGRFLVEHYPAAKMERAVDVRSDQLAALSRLQQLDGHQVRAPPGRRGWTVPVLRASSSPHPEWLPEAGWCITSRTS